MTKLNQESGRSMVEMLGVLAIIGVLSIGGIAGYTMAMNRYKANEILNAAQMLSIAAQSANAGKGDASVKLTDLGYSEETLHGATFAVTKTGQVTISGVEDLASTIKSISGISGCEGENGCVVAKGSGSSAS